MCQKWEKGGAGQEEGEQPQELLVFWNVGAAFTL